ncbi:MAG: DUF177 domain-containing protein [Clostridia bacterium]
MRINIAGITGKDGAYTEVSMDIPVEELGAGIAGIRLEENIHADLKAEYLEGMIMVKGRLSGRYSTECSRCLKNIKGNIDIEVNERFVKMSGEALDTDNYLYEGDHIDMMVPLIDNIFLGFPGAMVCSKDCKGLCQECGVDLNITECSCVKHEINMKMEKLKDFFNQ